MQIYVALLEKKASLSTGCYDTCAFSLDRAAQVCLALGHFDAIHIYPLKTEEGSLFQKIQENNREIATISNEEHYYHPLYMIPDENDSGFWNGNRPFVCIVRIHFAMTTHVNESFKTLRSALDTSLQDDVDVYLYRTVELSDAILAIQADRLQDLLSVSFPLQRWGIVGKVYTYCGIRLEKVREPGWRSDDRDVLKWCTMRFSIRSLNGMKDELDTIHRLTADAKCCKSFSIVGVDDIAISWNELPTTNLVNLFREWFFFEKSEHKLFQSFSDVTTRLGSPLQELLEKDYIPLTDKQKKEKEALGKACAKLQVKKDKIIKRINENGERRTWLKPLSELTAMLSRMSKSVLLDEFIYLILPGVTSFLDNVDGRFPDVPDELCEIFIEKWANIIEYIMPVEGQLTHHPEMRPILYDIPISMLEYTLAFLDVVAKALRSGDDAYTPVQIQLFLIPRLSREKATYELFAADAIVSRGLLLVYVPFDLLFEPCALLRALCHEVSHYVGEACRSRLERRDYFCKAAARLAVHIFFEHTNTGVIEEIDERLKQSLPRIKMTIKELIESVSNLLIVNMSKSAARQELMLNALRRHSNLIAKNPIYSEEEFPFYTLNWEPDFEELDRFETLLNDLGTLFREIYADIAMLYLLPVGTKEYITSHEEELRFGANPRYEQTAIRIYVSLTVCDKDFSQVCVQDNQLKEELERLQDCFERELEDRDRLLPISSIYYLKQYGKFCYEKMKTLIGKDDKEWLQKNYKNVSSAQTDYTMFLQCIDDYRQTLLDDYQC